MIEITISGNIPSKKNMLRFAAGRKKPYYDPEVRQRLNEINEAVMDQWGLRAPLVDPAMAVIFYVQSGASDRDNKFTTILDALVAGGVLKDDSIDLCNGEILLGKAYRGQGGSAGARVFLEPDGNLLRLYNKIKGLEDLQEYRVVRDQARKSKRGLRQ